MSDPRNDKASSTEGVEPPIKRTKEEVTHVPAEKGPAVTSKKATATRSEPAPKAREKPVTVSPELEKKAEKKEDKHAEKKAEKKEDKHAEKKVEKKEDKGLSGKPEKMNLGTAVKVLGMDAHALRACCEEVGKLEEFVKKEANKKSEEMKKQSLEGIEFSIEEEAKELKVAAIEFITTAKEQAFEELRESLKDSHAESPEFKAQLAAVAAETAAKLEAAAAKKLEAAEASAVAGPIEVPVPNPLSSPAPEPVVEADKVEEQEKQEESEEKKSFTPRP